MPYGWTRVSSSPQRQRKGEIAAICARNHARLCETQTFYDNGDAQCYALIQINLGGQTDVNKLRNELGAVDWLALVDADEKAAGARP